MKKSRLILAGIAIGSLALSGVAVLAPIHQAYARQTKISFAEDIVPIFKGWCVSCHQPGGEGYKASGLNLTSYQGVMKGTTFGPMVIPGKPYVSNLMVLIEGRGKIRMPFEHKPLPRCLINNISSWIFQGAENN